MNNSKNFESYESEGRHELGRKEAKEYAAEQAAMCAFLTQNSITSFGTLPEDPDGTMRIHMVLCDKHDDPNFDIDQF